MNILVTGARGFIGYHLMSALKSWARQVVAFDLHPNPGDDPGVLEEAPRGRVEAVSEIIGDVRNFSDVLAAAEGVDGIVHLAAVSRSSVAEKIPYDTIATNIWGTTNVLEAASRQPMKPWIVIASSRVVHDYEAGLSPNQEGIYSLSKDVADRLLRYYTRRFGIFGLSLRLSDVYGSMKLTAGRLLTELLQRAVKGERLVVQSAQLPFDFIHHRDVVHGIELAIRYLIRRRNTRETASRGQEQGEGGWFEALSLASGRHITAEVLANLICEITKSTSAVEIMNRERGYPPLVNYTAQAFEKIGFRSSIKLEDGLREMAASLNHPAPPAPAIASSA